MASSNEKLVGRLRDRTIASLLDFKEREVDDFLPPEVQRSLRKTILDQVNEFTNCCLDIINGAQANDLYLERLNEILDYVRYDGDEESNTTL